jgi:hypothetical protein
MRVTDIILTEGEHSRTKVVVLSAADIAMVSAECSDYISKVTEPLVRGTKLISKIRKGKIRTNRAPLDSAVPDTAAFNYQFEKKFGIPFIRNTTSYVTSVFKVAQSYGDGVSLVFPVNGTQFSHAVGIRDLIDVFSKTQHLDITAIDTTNARSKQVENKLMTAAKIVIQEIKRNRKSLTASQISQMIASIIGGRVGKMYSQDVDIDPRYMPREVDFMVRKYVRDELDEKIENRVERVVEHAMTKIEATNGKMTVAQIQKLFGKDIDIWEGFVKQFFNAVAKYRVYDGYQTKFNKITDEIMVFGVPYFYLIPLTYLKKMGQRGLYFGDRFVKAKDITPKDVLGAIKNKQEIYYYR